MFTNSIESHGLPLPEGDGNQDFLLRGGVPARTLYLPLIVHPSRCTDSVEEVLAVMDWDDVYAHTYSPAGPGIFDEND